MPSSDTQIQVLTKQEKGYPQALESNSNPTLKTPVMKWSIKSIAGSPREALIAQLLMIGSAFLILCIPVYASWSTFRDDQTSLILIVIFSFAGTLYFIVILRQKTIYRYRIYQTKARLVYRLHYPKYAREFFKGFALVGIFLLILMALMAGSLLFLTGVGAMAFMAAIRLLTWQNPIKRDWGLPWHEYNFVTVDRKRRFIVTHMTDLTLGFEARLPDDALFEQYLDFLHSVLPDTAQYTEKSWEMSII